LTTDQLCPRYLAWLFGGALCVANCGGSPTGPQPTSSTTTSSSSTTTSSIPPLTASIAVDNAPCVVPSIGANVSCTFRGVASGGLPPYTYQWMFTGSEEFPPTNPPLFYQVSASGQTVSPAFPYCGFGRASVQLTINDSAGTQTTGTASVLITQLGVQFCPL